MINRKFKTDALFTYACQIGSVAFGFIYMFLITRYAGVDAFGAIAVLTAFSSVLGNLLSMRTNEAVTYFYKRCEAVGSESQCLFVLKTGMLLDFLAGAAIYFSFYLMAGIIANYFIEDVASVSQVQLFSFGLFLIFVRGTPLGYLQAMERFKYVMFVTFLESLLKVAIIGGMVFLWGKDLSFENIIYAILSASLFVSCVLYFSLITAMLGGFKGIIKNFDSSMLREFFSFSLKVFSSSALKSGNKNIDTLVLGFVASSSEVGLYSLIRQFLTPILFVSSPFSGQVYPKFVQAKEENRWQDISDTIEKINSKLTPIYLSMLVVIGPVAVGYLQWTGVDLDVMHYISIFVMAFTVYLSGKLWWSRPFSNAVDPYISLKANLYATLFSVITLYPLTVLLGMPGTALSMLGMMVMLTFYFKRTYRSHFTPV